MNASEVSLDLLKRYNVPGPRYTSYPTAPVWTENFTPSDYSRVLEESTAAKDPAPLSLYVHLPFCEKLCYFCGCTVVITGTQHALEDTYLEMLEREIDWVADRVGPDRPVAQFHLGGGTPTYFTPERLRRLGRKFKGRFRFAADVEMGVEVDPRVTTREHLMELARLGFNRLSMGVQDFEPRVQVAINRVQPYEDTKRLVEQARALGFPSVNMDLIFGLPFQTAESFSETIDKVLDDRSRPPRRLFVRERAVDEEAPERPAAAPAR